MSQQWGIPGPLDQVLWEKRLGRLINLWSLLEFYLGKSEVISGDSHRQGLSKSTILLCLPFWGYLLGDNCSMAGGQVILSETDGEWNEKKNSSLTHVGARNATCFEMAIRSRILAWKPHGWRSLVGYSPKSCKESDTTGQLSTCALLSRHNATCRDPSHLRVSLPEGTVCTWRHNTSGGMVPGSSMVTSGQQARENPTIHIVWVPGCKPGTVWMLRQRGEL